MPSILLLAATDRPENRSNPSVVKSQLDQAQVVVQRIITQNVGEITLCLPTKTDFNQLDSNRYPTLASVSLTDATVDLTRFDALVVLPPEDTEKVLHPFVAEAISHFMNEEKCFAVCSRTLLALRWFLDPTTVGMIKCSDVEKDESLCTSIKSHIASQAERQSASSTGVIEGVTATVQGFFARAKSLFGNRKKDSAQGIPADFSDQVYRALKRSFTELLAANPDQSFYAFALFTDDSLQFIHPVANSEEALSKTVQHYRETVDPEYGTTSTREGMRWSYGDWGFFPNVGGDYFDEINAIVERNFSADEDVFDRQIEGLWESVLNGFRRLEVEGFFGTGEARSKITLLPVGHIDEEMTEKWVANLNPPQVVEAWRKWSEE